MVRTYKQEVDRHFGVVVRCCAAVIKVTHKNGIYGTRNEEDKANYLY